MTAQPTNLAGLDLRAEIDRLRKDRKALILAHYYQKPEIQDLADFVGDSLELSRKAAATSSRTAAQAPIFFCRNSRIVGYHGLSVRPKSQRQSGL